MPFDPSEIGKLSEKKLKWGYWWVTHKVQVRKIFTLILGIIGAALVAFGAFGFLDWFFGSGVRERTEIGTLTQQVIPFASFREKIKPLDIVFDSPVVMESGSGSYDLFSRAFNPNEIWWVSFEYQITASGVMTKTVPSYLLPGETKNLFALGIDSDSRPGSPEISITNLKWNRVDPHEIQPSYAAWSDARLSFRLTGLEFVPPEPTDLLPVSNAKFTVINDTGFSYYTIGFFVTLYSGPKIVGVNYVTISELRAGERRPVEVSWFTTLPNVSRVEVSPTVNIFDESVYIPPGQ